MLKGMLATEVCVPAVGCKARGLPRVMLKGMLAPEVCGPAFVCKVKPLPPWLTASDGNVATPNAFVVGLGPTSDAPTGLAENVSVSGKPGSGAPVTSCAPT